MFIMCYNITLVNTDYFIEGSTDRRVPVTIPMGMTSHDVSFTVRNDTIIEPDETFLEELFVSAMSTSRGVLLARSGAMVTLQDSDTFTGNFVYMCTIFIQFLMDLNFAYYFCE